MMSASERSFAKTYQHEKKFLMAFLRRRGLSSEECEDLAQEVFLRALAGHEQRDETNQRRLLVTIARNLHIDQFRKSKRLSLVHDRNVLENISEPQHNRREIALRSMVETLMDSLQDRPESAFFRQYYQNNMTIQQIAQLHKTPQGTVATQISRYRKRLSKSWSEQLETVDDIMS